MSSDIRLHLKRINLLFTRSDNILIISNRPDQAKHQTHRNVGNFRPHEEHDWFCKNKTRVTEHEIPYIPWYYQILLTMENFHVLVTTGDH